MTICKLSSLFLFCALAGNVFSRSSQLVFDISKSPSSFLTAPFISSVLNDATDPAATTGVSFIIRQAKADVPAVSYELTVSSSHTDVISNGNIRIEKGDGAATLFLSPIGVGYSDIIVTLTYQKISKTITLHYAVSAASDTPTQTVWHTGG